MRAFHEQRIYLDTCHLRAARTRGLDFLAHWHAEAELIFLTAGQLRIGVNNQLLTLTAGQIVLVAPLDIHYYERCGDADGFMLIFATEFLDRQLLAQSALWTIAAGERLVQLTGLAALLVTEMQERQPFFELAASGLLRQFFAVLNRPDPAVRREPAGLLSRAKGFQTIQAILAHLEEHYREPLSRADIAARYNLSVAHFSRLFKAATGMTLIDYLTRLRLAAARQAISQTGQTMLAIALDNGFDSIRTFNRAFRKVYRQTPSACRAAGRTAPS